MCRVTLKRRWKTHTYAYLFEECELVEMQSVRLIGGQF